MTIKVISTIGTAVVIIAGSTYSVLMKNPNTVPENKEKSAKEQWWSNWEASGKRRKDNTSKFSVTTSVSKLTSTYKKKKTGVSKLKKDFKIKDSYYSSPLSKNFNWTYGDDTTFWTPGRPETFLLTWCNHSKNSKDKKIQKQYTNYCS